VIPRNANQQQTALICIFYFGLLYFGVIELRKRVHLEYKFSFESRAPKALE